LGEYFVIKFKAERKNIYFTKKNTYFRPGDRVIVEADKGIDLGLISYKKVIKQENEGDEHYFKIKHHCSSEDLEKESKNRDKEKNAFRYCFDKIIGHKLDMKLVDVEYQFDGKKITFFFTADNRVDFRSLVKDLASNYGTRIELRQIGVRDVARRIGGYGKCGLKLCCTTMIDEFVPITTKMARDQLLTGNAQKLSGACGRLMCCLAYEYDLYQDEIKKYPPIGSTVTTIAGKALIESIDIFKEKVQIKYEDGTEEYVTLEVLKDLEITESQNVGDDEELKKIADG